MSAASVINDHATAIGGVLGTISGLKVYLYVPGGSGLDSLPAATVDGPIEITRSEPEAGESQLGGGLAGYTTDWRMTWLVSLYGKFDEPETDLAAMRSLLGQVIVAVDSDPTLGGQASLGASVVRSTIGLEAEGEQTLVKYECELHTWSLV